MKATQIKVTMTRNGLKGYISTKQDGQFEYCEWSALQWMADLLEKGGYEIAPTSYYSAEQVAKHNAA